MRPTLEGEGAEGSGQVGKPPRPERERGGLQLLRPQVSSRTQDRGNLEKIGISLPEAAIFAVSAAQHHRVGSKLHKTKPKPP